MNKKFIVYGIIAIFVVSLAYALLSKYSAFQRISVQPDDASAKDVICDVTVTNPRGIPLVKNGDLIIESASCRQQFVANCGRFGLFSDVGTLRLAADGGLGSSEDIRISEGATEEISLSWCGNKFTTKFDIKLYNDNNEEIQVKKVILQ